MKSIATAFLVAMIALVVVAAEEEFAVRNFRSALEIKIGKFSSSQELRFRIHEAESVICGNEEDVLAADLEIRRVVRSFYDSRKDIQFAYRYETVKTYYVLLSEAENYSAEKLVRYIFPKDQCVE